VSKRCSDFAGRPIKNLPLSLEIDLATTSVEALYTRVSVNCGLSTSRIRITKGSDGSFVTPKTPDGRPMMVEETGLRDGSQVFVKDLGPQIAWRTVFVIEYLGPLFIHPLFLFGLRPYLYSNSAFNPLSYIPFNPTAPEPFPPPTKSQVLICFLVFLHFLKREYETLFVHRFSSATMPAAYIFRNSAHYWVLGGSILAYYLYAPTTSLHAFWWPKSLDPASNGAVLYGAVALWVFSEVSNYITHCTLRDLRPEGSTRRQIPRGYGFDLVACPNYLFESMAWLAIFVLSAGNWAAGMFLGVGTTTMGMWAQKKERRYRKEFKGAYRKKKAIIPGVW